MAKASGVGLTTVQQISRAFGLQPDRSETFKLSNAPLLIEKVRDIVGLYMNPPDHAVVFCVDEKSQIQALDRTQPLLPMRPGQVERRTNEQLRRSVPRRVKQLHAAIRAFIAEHHAHPTRFIWTKSANEILASIARFAQRTLDVHAAPLMKRTTQSGH